MKRILFFILMLIGLGFSAVAQEITVKGTVTDDIGPLPGVCVMVKGTMNGVLTDLDGNYSLKCEGNDVLEFNCLGYETVYIPVNGRRNISVEMTFDQDWLTNSSEENLNIRTRRK